MLDLSLVRLLQFVSPALPVGAFAYSQGLESAVVQGLLDDDLSTESWICGLLNQSLSQLDLPMLHHCLNALKQENEPQTTLLNQMCVAYRETLELRLESLQMGKALRRLLNDLQPSCQLPKGDLDWVVAFAFACHAYDIDSEHALLGYAWSWCENQVAAAIKLVPLGQTQGQTLLLRIAEKLPQLVAQAQTIALDNVGAMSPNMAILSAQHETQYSRLFRS